MDVGLGEMADLEYKPLIDDDITRKLAQKIKLCADLLKQAKQQNRFVLLRFHHDADGISGAFALSEITRMSAYQQNSAVYSVKDAVRDLSNISHEDKPVVILLDFSMNKESEEGLSLLKAARVELIIIDHHPPAGGITQLADLYITPWEFSDDENTSRYTAGYLASEVARACGIDAQWCARIACAGDKSSLLEHDESAVKKALVLDYLAANSSFGNNLRFYRNVLAKDELFASMFSQANDKIEEAAGAAMRDIRGLKAGNVEIFITKLDRIAKRGEFPNASKITTRVYDKLKGESPLMVLGIGERSIIMRLNDKAVAKGLAANSIAARITTSMGGFAPSGGGHKKAGAIRIEKGYANAVVEEIIRIAEQIS